MTFISKYAQALKLFLLKELKNDETEKFKIFIRTGFQIDVYIFVHDCQYYTDIKQKFDNFCKETKSFSDLEPIKGNDYIKIFFKVLPFADLEDSFYSNIVNNPNNIDYGPRYRFDSFYSTSKINLTKDDETEIPIITFYSHKGGVGRTTAMASYALHLAAQGKNVAIIDCDLEAPGYLNFFDLSEHEELIEGKKNGLVEFLCDSQFMGKDVNINDYILNVGARNQSNDYNPALDRIWLVPAGNLNEGVTEDNALKSPNRQDYLEGLAKLNLGNTQKVIKSFNALFEQLKTLNVDAILIDSRTGFNDIFGTATLHLSSCVVGFFGLSRQNEPGLINLLAQHVKNENLFELILAYSILPKNYKEDNVLMEAYNRMEAFIMGVYDKKNVPARIPIHRNDNLERIGIGDYAANEKFIDMNTSTDRDNQFSDYTLLFNEIDRKCFPSGILGTVFGSIAHALREYYNEIDKKAFSNEQAHLIAKDANSNLFDLRSIILQHLRKVLKESANSAEDSAINESTFFYRTCMNNFFDRDKFIICGRMGTGKTYLYKALQNNQISNNIKRSSSQKDDNDDYIFINATPQKREEKLLLTDIAKHSFDKDFIFSNFWRIYIWTKLLHDDGNESLAKIRKMVKQQRHAMNADKPEFFVEMPYDKEFSGIDYIKYTESVDVLLGIVGDLQIFNELLKVSHKKVFILFDGLESYIHPLYWNNTISSLYDYCSYPEVTSSNIIPKIFVRTDLLPQIESLNTDLQSNNIINMEWSIEEVFGYFFKLIFSDPTTGSAYWNIARKLGIDPQYIANTEKIFETNNNQFKDLSQAEMIPLLQVFFGKDTLGLGRPWDYFKKELSNADNTANLQLFINIYRYAIGTAIATAESNITEIISPTIYASKRVRTNAATTLFYELVNDKFCKSLQTFQSAILFGGKGMYLYKSLDENKFENLINETTIRIDASEYGHKKEDLINMIFANGIMAINQTTKGKSFVFAPLYWFPWGLKDVDEKSNDNLKIRNKNSEFDQIANISKFIEGVGNVATGAGLKEFGTAATAVGSAVSMASEIAKMISKLSNKK
ncbi:KGGVGR-motif variant AAA ATPase [Fibrobacter sp. UWB5]|uniref:tyrosine-protein kinase family protein n=1 Tax=Fibrobacter sp. UWB5 TaxID=1964360 RepID=UPI000B5278DA|nr:P-loop NTPase [Fibrobacter sp. UWB5]OWV13936.1 hypothetical protein B7989_00220 [Fibrobacter sp. UWB5]